MLSVRALCRPGLQAISFDIADGECVALRGASGSGKTLLLRAIADLDPNEGVLTLDNERREAISAPRWRRLVSYVATEPGWWAPTVGEHMADWEGTVVIVEALGLPADSRDWPIQRLSTGERQRLALVRTLALHPRVLLLDEPTASLDADATAAAERLIGAQLEQGASALWVTHDDAQARRIARRSLVIEHGALHEAER